MKYLKDVSVLIKKLQYKHFKDIMNQDFQHKNLGFRLSFSLSILTSKPQSKSKSSLPLINK